MYVDNVREVLKNLNRVEYDSYLIRLRRILQDQFEKSVKPSALRMRVNEFKNGKNPNIEYFEAYLMAFEKLEVDGAIKALQGHKLELENPWHLLILRLSQNQELSDENATHLQNEQVNMEMEKLLSNAISFCADSSTEKFLDNLNLFNRFITMKK